MSVGSWLTLAVSLWAIRRAARITRWLVPLPLAGHRRVLDTAHRLVGNVWGDGGLTREQRVWVADPDLIRRPPSVGNVLGPGAGP
jgi:hypothetical protein